MYTIKRFSRTKWKDFRQGWIKIKDSDIWDGCERVNDDILKEYNQKWISDPFKTKYEVSKTIEFNRDYDSYKGDIDKDRLDRLISDIKKGFLYVDNGNIKPSKKLGYDQAKYPDETHYLKGLSEEGEYLAYSKLINTSDRLTYKIYKPVEVNGKQVINVELNSCRGHRLDSKYYSDTEDSED